MKTIFQTFKIEVACMIHAPQNMRPQAFQCHDNLLLAGLAALFDVEIIIKLS